MIYHITTKEEWQGRTGNSYRPNSFAGEGFIHCSRAEQLMAVANRFYRGKQNLLLLCIACERTIADIRYENLEGGEELYPHLYGPLNPDAVVKVFPLQPGPDGRFGLPDGLE